MEISDSYLANQLITVIKNSQKLNQPIEYQKFITFIAVLSKGSREEKLLLIFSIFGKGIPDKLNMRNNQSDVYRNDSDVMESNAYLAQKKKN